MKIKLLGSESSALKDGLRILSCELGVELCDVGEDLRVRAEPSREEKNGFSQESGEARISYTSVAGFFRALSRLLDRIRRGATTLSDYESPVFKTVGAMVDMSRNGAMNVYGVKAMLRKMAIMGMNTYMLYTEDNYEIDGYPYFGHLRGRYTKAEIKELDAYARALGIELIPCIQTSGHLATHLRWGAAAPYKDTASTLLSGEEKTYELIHAMMRSVSECFTTRRIHIGMDEARDLGSGKYLEKNGYRPRSEIFLDHLARVREIVKSYGFEAMMWSDMFFRLAAGGKIPGYRDYDLRVELTPEISRKVPKDVTQVFWDYYHEDKDFYLKNIDKHREFISENIIFAGGVYLWCGHCPLFELTRRYSIPALYAAKEKGVSEVLATVWLSGSEGMHILSLPGLAMYADFAYRGEYNESGVKETFRIATGDDISEVEKLGLPEHPDGGLFSLSRGLTYNDPLMGNADINYKTLPLPEYYEESTRIIEAAKITSSLFKGPHASVLALSNLLTLKANFGIRLKRAYDEGDTETLSKMKDECDEIIERIEALRKAHRAVWTEFCKPEGWEVHDIRYGGLVSRFDTVKYRLENYLEGRADRIGELEAERLAVDSKPENIGKFTDAYTGMKYIDYATVNIL